ncbi:hypothetical protein [Microvirga mediterraneensis]|uniref:Uncharacterized protein n=1 Tax=Microvirga mediterraneensis TaxID=2754695 RepID=A0A838BTC5_9HYPH|nr:hypothetical protein [Microvirga mediterraneensis]MBA1158681.1 hypothetical protein [Microvirga mediterraneensis]
MFYTIERFDRTSGELTETEENWLTVTEVGQLYRVGNRTTRAILHHMGLLQQERGRYRLTQHAVKTGLGRRHDKTKSGNPFDAISPLGQAKIAEAWNMTVQDYAAELSKTTCMTVAREALDKFRTTRRNPITPEAEVSWLIDHFSRLTHDHIATLVEITQPLVSRYAKARAKRRAFYIKKMVEEHLEDLGRPTADRDEVAQTLDFYTGAPCQTTAPEAIAA